ncbi:unnamed protein product [Dracunculus medinensis]|uniref:Uncharacterized protein n=1 Tax=Dracunculus medinensis TaxID=318479 RepID=A0A3P7PJT7_DRAME|nr:unnamed protein product [Dracunculus medinensis]
MRFLSGKLDDSSKQQMTEVNDKVLYRHYQQRNKFKDAIDYLDQIFEDFNKEREHNSVSRLYFIYFIKFILFRKRAVIRVLIRIREENSNFQLYSLKCMQNFKDLEGSGQRKVNNFDRSSTNDVNIDVSETIILKLDNDKLDFTKKWLADDIKSWATVQMKPDLLLSTSEETDFDERSLGSCSAEVAAINSLDRQKKYKDTPDLIQNVNANQKPKNKVEALQSIFENKQRSANSSQTGGYCSSGSLEAQSSSVITNHQPSLPPSCGKKSSPIGKQSISSHAQSIEDDEDDGFYDNLQLDDRRFSRASELDASVITNRLPPTIKSTNRLGQFFRKIGSSKTPTSAASLISLNRRIKSSIFGSKKRLN